MKNLHKIFSDWKKNQVVMLAQVGIKVEAGYDSFWLEENEVYWQLKPHFDKWEIKDTVISKFSEEEEDDAKRLVLLSPWANGYPMPDGDRGYLKTTYDDKDYCLQCGMGLVQKEPFRLKKEPTWGNKKMFSLNWIFDEFFVRRDFYEEALKKYAIEVMPVLLYKKETVIENTVQLKIPTTDTSLQLDEYDYEVCQQCNRKRYNLINKGFFPSFSGDVNASHLFKSKEYFGTGANARKYVFLSQEIRQLFLKHKIKANYMPCK